MPHAQAHCACAFISGDHRCACIQVHAHAGKLLDLVAPARFAMLSVKHGARSVEIPIASTLDELNASVRTALDLPEGGQLRLICKGKAVDSNALAAIKAGSKVMATFSSAASLDQAASARPERMRGFEEADRMLRTGGLGGRGTTGSSLGGSSQSPYRFHRTQAIPSTEPRFAMGATPGPDEAAALLRKLASDSNILSLMERRRWSVGLLAEMPPQGLVGVSSSCLMGLNRNRGQSIHLRLRTDDWLGLRPYEKIVEVLLHELTHNVHDDHDDDFKALNSELAKEYRANLDVYRSARSTADGPVRDASVEPLEAEDAGYTLGGGEAPVIDARAAAAAAASRRAASLPVQAPECAECDEQMDETGGV